MHIPRDMDYFYTPALFKCLCPRRERISNPSFMQGVLEGKVAVSSLTPVQVPSTASPHLSLKTLLLEIIMIFINRGRVQA